MMQGNHFVGEQVAGRTLSEYAGTNSKGHHLWKWECPSCGKVKGPSTIYHLKRYSRCSDCRNIRGNNPRWQGYEQMSGTFLSYYQVSAAKRNLIWDVTPEYLWNIWSSQRGKCVYTGRQLTHGLDASIDRIDSSLGYLEGNVQWVHRSVNFMKGALTEEDFLSLCTEIHEFRKFNPSEGFRYSG